MLRMLRMLRSALAAVVMAVSVLARADAPALDPSSDFPEPRVRDAFHAVAAPTYRDALERWRTPQDVNAWIGARFEYDAPRALLLSETQRAAGTAPSIHAPADFHADPRGICVDLARFAVETLRAIAPQLDAKYLMIEFDPVTLSGNVLRRHWVATYEDGGQRYFFADSKRPGHIDGPYASTEAYLEAYARYRQRTIVAFRTLDSYQRRMKTKAAEQRQQAR
jgi:hypothetical protein